MKKAVVALAGIALVATALPATAEISGPVVSKAVHHDTSPPLTEMIANVEETAPTGIRKEIPFRVVPEVVGRGNDDTTPDPLRQSEARPVASAGVTPSPILNFDGLDDVDGVVPPDTEGDVGKDHYIQWVNLRYAIYDKATGSIVSGPFPGNTFWDGFGGDCETLNSGDPIVLYDHLADRWVFQQFAVTGFFTVTGTICMAVSTTPDPTGPYHRYEFDVDPNGLPDYPKVSTWDDAYYLTTRNFDGGVTFTGYGLIAMEREEMLVGGPARIVNFELPSDGQFGAIQPSNLNGPYQTAGACNTHVQMWDGQADGNGLVDGYRLYDYCVDWTNPANSTVTELPQVASVGGFNREMCGFFVRNCIDQPSPGESLDPFDEATMYRAEYRCKDADSQGACTDARILVNHTVDVTGGDLAGVRWAELQNTGSGWTLKQEGTYSPDNDNRWMGSMNADGCDNAALGYSVSSTSTFPSVRYTTRRSGDAPGTLPGGEVEAIAGTGAQTSSANRWGDYSTMSVDPMDDRTFWYTQEYYATTSSFNYRTRITSFAFDDCRGDFRISSVDPGAAGVTNDVNVASGTANDRVAVVAGRGPGRTEVSTGVCWTITLDVANAVPLGAASTDSNGDGTFTIDVPAGGSGACFQAIDLGTCRRSNVVCID